MMEKVDDDAVAAAIFYVCGCKSERKEKKKRN